MARTFTDDALESLLDQLDPKKQPTHPEFHLTLDEKLALQSHRWKREQERIVEYRRKNPHWRELDMIWAERHGRET